MSTAVVMPKLGLLMTEGVIVKWLKPDGEAVVKGEPIVTIMTKKITYQVIAAADGILRQVARPEETRQIGEPLAYITEPGEPVGSEEILPPELPVLRPAPSEAAHRPIASERTNGFVIASPWARHLAGLLDVELSHVRGSGPDGCIVARDVRRFLAEHGDQRTPSSEAAAPGAITSSHGRTIPLSGMRRMIAGRMTESLHTMAPATLMVETDVTDLVRRRKQIPPGQRANFTDLAIKAAGLALVQCPQINATLIGDEIQLLDEIHIGFAVALPDGVLVPVVRDVDRRMLAEIATETRRLGRAARAGRLTVDEVTGSTFTVTNLGDYGVDLFAPIINPPEVAILGLGRVTEKPAVFHGQITPRSMMMLCLTFDHRVVDGAQAAAFLHTLSRLLASPGRLLSKHEPDKDEE